MTTILLITALLALMSFGANLKPAAPLRAAECSAPITGVPGTPGGPPGYVSGSAFAVEVALYGVPTEGKNGPLVLAHLDCDSKQTKARNSALALNIGELFVIGALEDEVTITQSADNIKVSERSRIGGISLLNGLIKADGIEASAVSTGTKTEATSTNTSTFVNLLVAGHHIQAIPPPNLRINLPGIGQLILNKQEQLANTTEHNAISVTAIDLELTTANVLGLPPGGHLRIAHVEGDFARVHMPQAIGALAYAATMLNPDISPPASGPYLQLHLSGNTSNHVEVSIPGIAMKRIGSAETMETVVDIQSTPPPSGQPSGFPKTRSATKVTQLSMLNGLITANLLAVTAEANTSNIDPTPAVSLVLENLNVDGKAIGSIVAPYTTIEIPKLGVLTINEQILTHTSTGASAEINALDLFVSSENTQGLPVGSHVIVGHAWAGTAKT